MCTILQVAVLIKVAADRRAPFRMAAATRSRMASLVWGQLPRRASCVLELGASFEVRVLEEQFAVFVELAAIARETWFRPRMAIIVSSRGSAASSRMAAIH